MAFRFSKLPKFWWIPFMGAGGLLVLGVITVTVVWTGGLVTDAEKARLPVERGVPTRAQLDHAITLNPTYLDAYVQRARLRLGKGEFQGASEDVDKAIELSPANQKLMMLRAEIRSASPAATTKP